MHREGVAIGIDLGTTYSCAAVVKDNVVTVIHGDDGLRTMASCVVFNEFGDRIIGNEAKNTLVRKSESCVFGVKRFIGRSYQEYKDKGMSKFHSYKVENNNGRPRIPVKYQGGIKNLAPEEISAMVLEKLKQRAEEFLCRKVTKAVITVPAHFNEDQRHATKHAGTIAGLEVLRIMNEPTAAALAYELQNKHKESTACNVLVYDFGGGTFDVSVVTIEKGLIDVKATNGEPFLGGDDIDDCLAENLIEKYDKIHNTKLKFDKYAVRRLRNKCEVAKRILSSSRRVKIDLDYFHQQNDFSETITRTEFQQICQHLFEKTMICVQQTLKDANMRMEDVDEVVLVGGSSRIPYVREMVQKFFNNKRLNASLHPDEAVAVGAARQAAILDGTGSQLAVILKDVTALSLGIKLLGDIMCVIIPRNSKLPASQTKLFQTANHGQTISLIEVYEGERNLTRDNRKLGEFCLTGYKSASRGEIKYNITFNIDLNGILHVSAVTTVDHFKNSATIDVKGNGLSKTEIAYMIKQAKQFQEQDEKIKAKIEERIQLQNYCYDTKLHFEQFATSRSEVERECDEALEWLESFEKLTVDDIKKKKRKLQFLVSSKT